MKRPLLFLLALGLAAVPLFAHGKGRIKLGSQRLLAGGQVEMTGEEFAKNAAFTVILVGAPGRVQVGSVKSDAAGKFTASLPLPADLATGSWRVVLEAADREVAASADVQVAAATQVAEDHHPEDMAAHDEHMPSAAPLELARARSPLVTGGALTVILVAIAAGAMLLRRNGA